MRPKFDLILTEKRNPKKSSFLHNEENKTYTLIGDYEKLWNKLDLVM